MLEILLGRHKKTFSQWIITDDEEWIHYDNRKRGKSRAKWNIHGAKEILWIWWDQKDVLYYELLKSDKTITGNLYRIQSIRLKRAITENRQKYATNH